VWESYRWQIIGGFGVIVLQSVSIAALLLHRRHRRRAEQNLRISESHRQTAVLNERNRMARDMHDTLAQGFTGVIVQLEAAKNASGHGASADMETHVNRATELARHSLSEARRTIRALRPEALEHSELSVALRVLMEHMTAGTELRGEFSTRGEPRSLTASTEDNLLRIHQEILTNTLKHSGAKLVTAALSFEETAVVLGIKDDGVGFDVSTKHDGLGLLGIRERVRQMNGKLTIESRRGSGTSIQVAIEDSSAVQPVAR
jgi:signal transduction histidine kinase